MAQPVWISDGKLEGADYLSAPEIKEENMDEDFLKTMAVAFIAAALIFAAVALINWELTIAPLWRNGFLTYSPEEDRALGFARNWSMGAFWITATIDLIIRATVKGITKNQDDKSGD